LRKVGSRDDSRVWIYVRRIMDNCPKVAVIVLNWNGWPRMYLSMYDDYNCFI